MMCNTSISRRNNSHNNNNNNNYHNKACHIHVNEYINLHFNKYIDLNDEVNTAVPGVAVLVVPGSTCDMYKSHCLQCHPVPVCCGDHDHQPRVLGAAHWYDL